MASDNTSETNQFLTFTLGEEVFALNIVTVREVLEMTNITKIPRTPPFMRGVINLRGHAVPVVDLRRKFGMHRKEDTVNTCIIIVEVAMDDDSVIMGAIADSVREVFEMRPDQVDPAPKMGACIDTNYILGMGKQDDKFVIILDINRVFSYQELSMLSPAPDDAGDTVEEPLEVEAG